MFGLAHLTIFKNLLSYLIDFLTCLDYDVKIKNAIYEVDKKLY